MNFVNQQSNHLFGVYILIAVFSIAFITLMSGGHGYRRSFATTSLITFFLCMILKLMNLVPMLALSFCSILFGLGMVLLLWEYFAG